MTYIINNIVNTKSIMQLEHKKISDKSSNHNWRQTNTKLSETWLLKILKTLIYSIKYK